MIELPKDYINFKRIGILKADGTVIKITTKNLRKMSKSSRIYYFVLSALRELKPISILE